MKDFIGRTIVLDEGEFEETDGYEQQGLFDDVYKDVLPGYGQKFQEYETEIIDAINSDRYVGTNMDGFGYLVTYIRQTVLRYGEGSGKRMAETGVMLSPSQIAAIKYKLESLTIPKDICMHNRYWDPVILDCINHPVSSRWISGGQVQPDQAHDHWTHRCRCNRLYYSPVPELPDYVGALLYLAGICNTHCVESAD